MASVRFAGHRAGAGCQTGRPVLFRSGSAAPMPGREASADDSINLHLVNCGRPPQSWRLRQ